MSSIIRLGVMNRRAAPNSDDGKSCGHNLGSGLLLRSGAQGQWVGGSGAIYHPRDRPALPMTVPGQRPELDRCGAPISLFPELGLLPDPGCIIHYRVPRVRAGVGAGYCEVCSCPENDTQGLSQSQVFALATTNRFVTQLSIHPHPPLELSQLRSPFIY